MTCDDRSQRKIAAAINEFHCLFGSYSGPRKLDKAISVKDIILSPTQGGLPDEQEEAQFYA